MKILMLSWEYPPKNVGGLSTHVHNLSHALANLGHEVHVVTCEEGTAPIREMDGNIYVHRVSPYNIATDDFAKWVMHLNFAMIEEGYRIVQEFGKMDLIHSHDWLTTYAGKALKWSLAIPLISTIHATETGRNGGIRTETQRYISTTEWLLTTESSRVITCSSYMKNQVVDLLKAQASKTVVIKNGVENSKVDSDFDKKAFINSYAADGEKIVLFVGRHVYEKGVHLLIEAAPEILRQCPKAKFVITGQGSETDELKQKVYNMKLENKILFTGYIDNKTRDMLYKVSNVAVFPSLYEPFGIVALEAMEAGCPVVVSDTGGFSEIIEHKVNGLKMINGLSNSLKDNVLLLLQDEELAKKLKETAFEEVREKYSWESIAAETAELYKKVVKEFKGTIWSSEDGNLKKAEKTTAKKTTKKKTAAEAKIDDTKTKETATAKKTTRKKKTEAADIETTEVKPKRTRKKAQ